MLVLFFFKQKTAYEVRISDWSSDVCSSDLRRPRRGAAGRRLPDDGRGVRARDHRAGRPARADRPEGAGRGAAGIGKPLLIVAFDKLSMNAVGVVMRIKGSLFYTAEASSHFRSLFDRPRYGGPRRPRTEPQARTP